MASKIQKSIPCPEWETWCAYVEGSLSAIERPALKTHLSHCDRCFALVVSIKRAVESTSDTIDTQTPEWLKHQATGRPATSRKRWPVYAAAAAIVLGFGLHAIYRSYESQPDSEIYIGQLALLNTQMQTHGVNWSDITFERRRGSATSDIVVSERAKAAVTLGAALVQLTLEWQYAGNAANAQYQLSMIQFALKQLPQSEVLRSSVQTLASGVTAEPDASNLATLRQNATQFAQGQSPEIAAYFALGQWLQSQRIILKTAAQFSILPPEQTTQQFDQLHNRLQEIQASESLMHHLSELRGQGTPQAFLTRIESLLNALTLS